MMKENWNCRVSCCVQRGEKNTPHKQKEAKWSKNTEEESCIIAGVLPELSVLVHFISSQAADNLIYSGAIPSGSG